VNYDTRTKNVTEWNVGCEKCHGPGSLHVESPSATTVVNPAKLDYVHANDVCIECHSQGRPPNNPIEGRYYDWPAGFHVGLDRMQGNDFVQSVMDTRGVTCFSCHDVHGTQNNADLIKPASDLCSTCHRPNSPNGPHTPTIEAHTHHRAGSAGNECVSCHMPRIEQTIANVNVRSHTFRFITPGMTERDKVPNPCVGCHTDRTNEWATAELRQWSPQSPWRLD
jgi:predicted CXXCH cytochrome family protein